MHWRLQYTGDAMAALAEPLNGLLADEDGSFGAGTEVWFFKLDASVDRMLADDFTAGDRPPRFLDRVNDSRRLEHYLVE
jgi:hypothetical protein